MTRPALKLVDDLDLDDLDVDESDDTNNDDVATLTQILAEPASDEPDDVDCENVPDDDLGFDDSDDPDEDESEDDENEDESDENQDEDDTDPDPLDVSGIDDDEDDSDEIVYPEVDDDDVDDELPAATAAAAEDIDDILGVEPVQAGEVDTAFRAALDQEVAKKTEADAFRAALKQAAIEKKVLDEMAERAEIERAAAARVAAIEKAACDQYVARIEKNKPNLDPPSTEKKEVREWNIDFGPLWAPAGEVSVITVRPQVRFRGEKIIATDTWTTAGTGTRILSVAVGQKIQRPGNDGGTLTSIFGSSALADGITFDTAHEWATIALTVSFVQACTFDASVFGRAEL